MAESNDLELILFSFGYKYGYPEKSNLLLDVRCLPNPYWDEKLRPYTGLEPEVAQYVRGSEEGEKLLERLDSLLLLWAAQQAKAGKSELHIAIGCTGGRHRSVAIVEALALSLQKAGFFVSHFHRDIARDGAPEEKSIE